MTRRLGRPGSAPRRLLVSLSSEQEVGAILRQSKLLRKSSDACTARNVFINPDLSPDDAKRAFEVRKARREAKVGPSSSSSTQSGNNNNCSGTSSSSVNHHTSSVSRNVSALTHQNFPPIPPSSRTSQPSSSQPLQSPSLGKTKSLSPSATPFVATIPDVSSTPSSSAAAAIQSTGGSASGVTNNMPGCSSSASTSSQN